MRYTRFLFIALLLSGALNAFGQAEDQQQYNNAKQLFNDEQYSLAMAAFKPLIEREESNPYSAYASFYYAVAAYRDGYQPLARNMFLQINQRYPDWSMIHEVRFWLGKLYFDSKEYNQGLNALSKIKEESLKDDVYQLKYTTFNQIKDRQLLLDLYHNRPDEKALGEVLAFRIASDPLVDQDQELLSELIRKFDLNEAGLEQIQVQETVFKDTYRVAVMFPFLTDYLEANERKKVNQLILDLYQGIRLAADELKEKEINIELFAYDVKRDSATTADILARDEMKSMDLIIGPLFPEPILLTQDFSFRNKINMINPISTSSDVIDLNPYSFLLHPSDETIGEKTAEHVSGLLSPKPGVIIYGDTKGDSLMAYAYKERIEKDGHDIIITQKIEKDSSRHVIDLLLVKGKEIKEAAKEEAREEYTLPLDSIGHVFVASENELITSKVISAMETRGDSVLMIGSAEWLSLPVDYGVYHRRGVILYAPMYVRKETEAYNHFREMYVKRHRIRPTDFAELGYEVMLFAGNCLQKYGKYFQLGLSKEEFVEGYLTYGFVYPGSQDNKLVPVMDFDPEELHVSHNLQQEEPEQEAGKKEEHVTEPENISNEDRKK